jgi:hypothetical protein
VKPVAKLSAHLSSLAAPNEIRSLQGWVIWRLEHHEGEDKPRKVPYYANGQRRHGRQGSADDRRSLVTFEAARAAAARRGMDGVGLALLPEWGLVALDFDGCIADGALHPEVAEIAAQSYAEYSPSGKGVRVLFKGNLLNRKSFEGAYGFETFSTKGFVTVTGNVLELTELYGNENTIAEVTLEARALFAKRFGQREERSAAGHDSEVLGLSASDIDRCLEHLDPSTGHDEWLSIGMALHHETRGEGFETWNAWSEGSDKYPGRDVLRYRWDSFGRGGGPAVTGRTLVHLANKAGAGVNTGAGPASAEEFEVLATAGPGAPAKYVFEPVASFASAQGGGWWMKQVLPKAGLAVLYGASGAGKSFVVLDMAMSLARGLPWRGKRCAQARVAYIAAEGAGGFRKRVAAYAQHHDVDLTGAPVVVLNAAPNLMDPKDSAAVAQAVQAAGGADVIVVDTFAQVMPGANENAGEDVGKALGHCKRIHEVTGALVVLVHHSGKDQTRGARGWSGLRAAADAEIEVVKTEAGARYIRLSKSKDDVDGLEWGFELQQVALGVDDDLEPITSCVVKETEVNKAKAISRQLGPVETVVNAVLQEFARAQLTGIEVEAVIVESVRRMPEPDEGKRDARRQHVRRALKSLTETDGAPYQVEDDGTISVL